MIILIVASHRLHINPDNVVCLMAGSFGDIVSLSVLSTLSDAFFVIHGKSRFPAQSPCHVYLPIMLYLL